MSNRKKTLNTTTAEESARDLIARLKFHFHRYRHEEEACLTEALQIMSGRRQRMIRMHNMRRRADASRMAFDNILAKICLRIKNGDTRLPQLLTEKFADIADKVYQPLETE